MKKTITYAGREFQVTEFSLPPENVNTFPQAGVHPVVQVRGKTVSLLSPVELQNGDSFSAESGFDIPYTVRVQSCMNDGRGQFRVFGVIE